MMFICIDCFVGVPPRNDGNIVVNFFEMHRNESLSGKLLVFEGGAGSGKSTQAELLGRRDLKDWQMYREPGGTPFGELIRGAVQGMDKQYSVEPYAQLFAYSSARAQLIRGVVIPALEAGYNVGLDRYWYSSFAYQGAAGVNRLIIWAVNMIATRGLKPNLVLHYDLDPVIGMERKRRCAEQDKYDMASLEVYRKRIENYRIMEKMYPNIWRRIDASKSIEEVYADSVAVLEEFGMI